MQTALWLLVALLLALPLRATIAPEPIPPDLADLTQQIERFPQDTAGTESERLAKFFDLYWAASMREAPAFAAYIGYRGVDDRLPDLSPETHAHSRRLLHLELAALASIDRSRLTPAEQQSYDLLLRSFEEAIEGERFPGEYLLVDRMGNRLTQALGLLYYMPTGTVGDYENMLTRLRGFPRLVEQGIALLEEGVKRGVTPPRVTLDGVAAQVLAPLANDPLESPTLEPFQRMPDTIPAAERERLRGAAAEVFRQQVAPALSRLHDYLADSYVPRARESISVAALPDGEAYYAYLLRAYTTTDLSPDQIHQLGLSEVARIRKEMDEVVAATGFQGTFQEFLEHLRTDPRFFYDRPEDLVAGYRDIVKRIDPELPRLFGRLPRLPYGVKPMGDDDAKLAPSALYENGSLAAGRPGWMRVNTFDLRARPKWAMESLAAHEAVPGHHLQYALVEELGALPEWRRWDIYPVFSEGWGLYAESLGGELGLYRDPYSKFGQLNAEMWRAIRLVVDTGLHAKGWTRQQTIDYCRANSARTDREIANEVDRYIVQPGGVTCYKIGELKIRELRRYAEKELGATFDVRAFHDRVLGHGQLPLDLLQKSIEAWVAASRPERGPVEGRLAAGEIAPGVHLLPGSFVAGSQPDGNTVVFRGPDGLVVVDTGRHAEHTQAIVDFAKAAGVPVRTIVNTHWHLDHIGGNPRLRREFPGLKVHASQALEGAMKGFLASYRTYLEETIAKAPDAEAAKPLRAELAILDAGSALAPDEVVTTSGARTLAGRRLVLELESRAVTEGDVWVLDPEARVLAAGDLVTLPAPFFDTACPARWKAALEHLSKADFELLVPGHGEPMRRQDFDAYRQAFDGLLACAASPKAQDECVAGWLRDAGTLVPEKDQPLARSLVEYYLENHLRADPAKVAKLCTG